MATKRSESLVVMIIDVFDCHFVNLICIDVAHGVEDWNFIFNSFAILRQFTFFGKFLTEGN